MGTKISNTGGGDFTPAPAGIHRAVCISYVDLGHQESEFNGESKIQNKVILMWELPDELIKTDDGEKPYIVSKFYTKSLHEKANMRHDLVAWRGREFTEPELEGFDLDNILGKACQVNIIHETKNGKVRAKLTAVLPLSKGMNKPEPSVTPWRYDMAEDRMNFPDQLSDGMKKLIMKSKEMNSVPEEPMPEDTTDFGVDEDSIPF